MHLVSFRLPHISRSMVPGLTLLLVWFAGSSLGLLAERFHGGPLGELVMAAGGRSPDILDSCTVTLLSLLFTACAVFLFHRPGAYLACFFRGFFLGFVLGAAVSVGGALYGLLLVFSGLCFSPVLLVYLWRRLMFGMRGFAADTSLCAAAGALLSAVDALVISPFLAVTLTF